MSDSENFLTRWSRRKRAVLEEREQTKAPAPSAGDEARAGDETRADVAAAPSRASAPAELPFDLTRLPSLESITATTDIRAFLAPGVPPELTRAALRRAWESDPKIRDFVGLAEYAWDYNAPGSMVGFGPLEMTDELRRLVAQMVGGGAGEDGGERPPPPAAAPPETQTANKSGTAVASKTDLPVEQANAHLGLVQDQPLDHDIGTRSHEEPAQEREENIALQHGSEKSDDLQAMVRRPHGRALPK
jgi:hypothetical protein